MRKHNIWALVLVLILPVVVFTSVKMVYAGPQASPGKTAQTLIDEARVVLKETTATFWTDTQLLGFLNQGMKDIADTTYCMQTTETFDVSSGTTRYTITTDYAIVRGVLYVKSGSTSYQKALERKDLFDMEFGMGRVEYTGEPAYWDEWNATVYIWPPADSDHTGTAHVFLADRPSTITLTGGINIPAVYERALLNYIIFRALLRDNKWDKAQLFGQLYYTAIGVKAWERGQDEKAPPPNTNR